MKNLTHIARLIRKEMAKFETLAEANAENRTRITILRRVGNKLDEPVCLELADRLEGCIKGHPCGSMACSRCSRQRRLRLVNKWLDFFQTHPDYVMVTLIFYDEMFPNKLLLGWDLNRLKQRLRKQLERIGFEGTILGGFEMDYHRHTQQPDESRWMPHFHLLLPNDPAKIKQLHRYMLRPKNLHCRKGKVNRPMRKDPVVDVVHAFTYCFKAMWQELPIFVNAEGELTSGRCKRRLKDPVFAKSLVKLDRLTDSQLTLTMNVHK
ncbi:hypothetical protein [Serratia oryzae]|uniref:hypothetical protein n=1 Tax=Serratia oryzae TaxID=2034155 RepID=UPI0012E105EB|nr:hypothetical protein [Serratia oryzae]